MSRACHALDVPVSLHLPLNISDGTFCMRCPCSSHTESSHKRQVRAVPFRAETRVNMLWTQRWCSHARGVLSEEAQVTTGASESFKAEACSQSGQYPAVPWRSAPLQACVTYPACLRRLMKTARWFREHQGVWEGMLASTLATPAVLWQQSNPLSCPVRGGPGGGGGGAGDPGRAPCIERGMGQVMAGPSSELKGDTAANTPGQHPLCCRNKEILNPWGKYTLEVDMMH